MECNADGAAVFTVALRKESVDRNRLLGSYFPNDILSLSARRAWIEMMLKKATSSPPGSLSARRAWIEIAGFVVRRRRIIAVALRKESVDRNDDTEVGGGGRFVALRKESVDRNFYGLLWILRTIWSLSARRAWIEIIFCISQRAGSPGSLSARRAWIEIT